MHDIVDKMLSITLDEACRKQQLGEGWFPTFDDVPKQASSRVMTRYAFSVSKSAGGSLKAM